MGDKFRDDNTKTFFTEIDTVRESFKGQIDDLFESFKQNFKVSDICDVFKFQLHQFQGSMQVQLNSLRQWFQQTISRNRNPKYQKIEKDENYKSFDIPKQASSQINDIFSRYQHFCSQKFQVANIHEGKLRINNWSPKAQNTPEQNFKEILDIINISGNLEDNLIILLNEIYLRVSEANSQKVYFNNINPLNVRIRVFNEKISVRFGAPLIWSQSMLEYYGKFNFSPKCMINAPEILKYHTFSHPISPENDIKGVQRLFQWINQQVQVSHSKVIQKTYLLIMDQICNTYIQKIYQIGEIINIKQQEKILQIQYYKEQSAIQNKLTQIQGFDKQLILCPSHGLILKYSKNQKYFCIRCLAN